MPRPRRARSLTNFNRCFALSISAAVLKTAEVSNESAESLTNVRFKKKLDKKEEKLILLNKNIVKYKLFLCVIERIVKLLNHNHEELFSSKTKVRQEFRFFLSVIRVKALRF